MLEQLQALPQDLGRVKRLLADTGYASEGNVNACAKAKIQPLIALGRDAHHGLPFARFAEPAPPPSKPTPMAAMRHRLQTRRGRTPYALRKCTVEPVFGLIKQVMKFRQFLLRGINGARGEWSLVCLTWNLKRLNALNKRPMTASERSAAMAGVGRVPPNDRRPNSAEDDPFRTFR